MDVFGVGSDHALWHRALVDGGWHAWESLGGQLTSSIEAIGRGSLIDVFAVGADSALQTRHWDGAAWSAWTSLGGTLFSGPSAVSWSADRLDVFALGRDSNLVHIALAE